MLIPAYAKVNLYLEVKGRLENGYHDLKMVMQSISLHDDLHIKKNNRKEIRVDIINKENFDDDQLKSLVGRENIVYKVAEALMKEYIPGTGADIGIYKRIPMQAGLGGGSTDAASALLALNYYFKLGLGYEELSRIGEAFGADIPFCIRGGLAIVEGIGEKVRVLPSLKKFYMIIVKPDTGISTKEAYSYYDRKKEETFRDTDFNGLIKALEKEELSQISAKMFNDLETAAFNMSEDILRLKNELKNIAGNALMTGSGSAVFALFDDQNKAKECFERIKRFDNRAQMFFANTI